MVYGTDNSSEGPYIQIFTDADNYPLFQLLSQKHHNVGVGFDTYFDGSTYRSSKSSSNFLFGKFTNQLQFL